MTLSKADIEYGMQELAIGLIAGLIIGILIAKYII
jgi:hypothetical protein